MIMQMICSLNLLASPMYHVLCLLCLVVENHDRAGTQLLSSTVNMGNEVCQGNVVCPRIDYECGGPRMSQSGQCSVPEP